MADTSRPNQQRNLFGDVVPDHQPRPTSASTAVVRVAFDSGVDQLFDYAVPDDLLPLLKRGCRVRVPFGKGNRSQIAFCVEFPDQASVSRIKPISEILDSSPLIDDRMLNLAHWISSYYCCPLGAVLSAMVPAAVKHQVGLTRNHYVNLTEKALQSDPADLRLSTQGRAILDHLKTQTNSTPALVPLDQIKNQLQTTRNPFTTLARNELIQITTRSELPDIPLPGITGSTTAAADFELNEYQISVLEQTEKLIALQNQFSAILLHGVTGSGKTEIYIRCIEKITQQNRQALVLVPEISLTPQTVERFLARFENVAIMHSGLSSRQRHQQWRWIADGHVQVVVGARSAIFAPLQQLGLIVIDEEHEPSYKQETIPRYHARDVAVMQAQMLKIPIILGSATPSLESWHNCQTKKHYHLLQLPQRVLNLPLPPVKQIDMAAETAQRKGFHLISRTLEHELRRTLDAGRQAIILLNRRGHSSYIFCPSCKFVLTCPNCDVSLTCHKTAKQLQQQQRSWVMCHHCGHNSKLPNQCPVCSRKLMLINPGTQQAEEELTRKFSDYKVLRVDSDSIKPDQYHRVLSDFGTGKIDILMGTQMIGKGLDFPNVALVGVLNADTALYIPDFRSSERSFQLITQVAGRCGRADAASLVIVQSFLPEEPAIKLACRHDYESFARDELVMREQCHYPPYYRLARIILRDQKLDRVEAAGQELRGQIDQLLIGQEVKVGVRGPVPPVIARLENYHRRQILLHAAAAEPIQWLLGQLRGQYLPSLAVQCVVDVDPMNLM